MYIIVRACLENEVVREDMHNYIGYPIYMHIHVYRRFKENEHYILNIKYIIINII